VLRESPAAWPKNSLGCRLDSGPEVSRGKRGKILARDPLVDLPLPTPHDCRHTYGTRLAEQNVPSHEIGALMGHADARSTARYVHAGEIRFERARSAIERARSDSQVTHDVG
jgi:integrase